MWHIALFSVLGICLGVGIWQLVVWVVETLDKNKKYKAAEAYARESGKPLLVAGGPWGNKQIRHQLNIPAHGSGDVCLDVDRNAIGSHPNGVIADVTHIPFSDKSFGAAFASHLLEHLSSTDEAEKALAELNRTAEAVFIAYPFRQSITGWLISDHHLWVWQKGNTTYLKQRGESAGRQRHILDQPGEDLRVEDSSLKVEEATEALKITDEYAALQEKAGQLAQQLCGDNIKKCASFTRKLLDMWTTAQGKDFLLVHNPGGWGSTHLDNCLQWERSIVEGISSTMERLGHSWLLTQYFRGGNSWWAHLRDMKEQINFLLKGKSYKARMMAAELQFITQHSNNLKVILIGISQGAAFSNTVMQQLDELHQVYSIELGLFFPHMPRRVVTENTLAIDSNGLMPDPVAHRNLKIGLKTYVTAPFRWTKCRLQGKPEAFAYCINVPGHEYSWEFPEVKRQIEDFLESNFGTKSKLEVGTP